MTLFEDDYIEILHRWSHSLADWDWYWFQFHVEVSDEEAKKWGCKEYISAGYMHPKWFSFSPSPVRWGEEEKKCW